MATSEAQKKAQKKYDSENTKSVMLKLNRKTDTTVIDQLDAVPNRQGYIKELVKQDVKKGERTIMTSHEALILGWIWGSLEKLLPNYDVAGNKFEEAAWYPMAGMAEIMAAARKARKISPELDAAIMKAMNEISAETAEHPQDGILPVPLQGSWQIGYYRAMAGNNWNNETQNT